MSNSKDTFNIDYVAKLARLELSEEEKQTFEEQLGSILQHFEKLAAIDTSNVDALAHPFPSYNVWDEDVPHETFTVQEALMNAPETKDNFVQVPKVVES